MTNQSKKLAVLAVVALGWGIAAAPFTGVALGSRIVGVEQSTDAGKVDQRIDAAFDAASASPASGTALNAAAQKGDLQAKRCAAERWPVVSVGCLLGGGSTHPVSRTVTVEYRTGAQSSMLVRMPVELVALR